MLARMIISYRTLLFKEIKRFTKVYHQAIITPVISSLLFYVVFSITMQDYIDVIHGVPYLHFIAAGLIAMSIIQNAFSNSAFAILVGKINGAIIDFLFPPFSSNQIIFCINFASFVRCLILGLLSWLVFFIVNGMDLYSLPVFIIYTFLSSMILGSLGIIIAIFSNRFDELAAYSNYFIIPLSFLSGSFYSIDHIPSSFHAFAKLNPCFIMVSGIRYSFTGFAEYNIYSGILYLSILSLLFWLICKKILDYGWGLKK